MQNTHLFLTTRNSPNYLCYPSIGAGFDAKIVSGLLIGLRGDSAMNRDTNIPHLDFALSVWDNGFAFP